MTIRTRLALWYGLAIAATVAAVGIVVWLRFAADLRSTLETALAVQAADATGAIDAGDATRALTEDPGRPGIFTVVLDRSGRVVLASRTAPAGIGPVPLGASTVRLPGANADLLLVATRATDGRLVVAGSSTGGMQRDIEGLAGQLAFTGALAAVASLAGGWLLARRALAPVARLTADADRINGTPESLESRLTEPRTQDEVGRLARTLNRMLDRVESGVRRQREFVAAASHDLRTPITALHTELELALRSRAPEAELREAIERAMGDARRLGGLADDLLGLAAAERDGRESVVGPVELRPLVEGVMRLAARNEHGEPVGVDVEVGDEVVLTDRVRVEQALGNLVANAARHSPAAQAVTVHARTIEDPADPAGRLLAVDVMDRGPGVGPAAVGQLFVPFAAGRPETGRTSGLGLATAAAAVHALRGRIGYEDRPGGGAWFWFRVPVAGTPTSPRPTAG